MDSRPWMRRMGFTPTNAIDPLSRTMSGADDTSVNQCLAIVQASFGGRKAHPTVVYCPLRFQPDLDHSLQHDSRHALLKILVNKKN